MTELPRFEDLAESHTHLLDDPEAHRAAVQRSNEFAVSAGLIKTPVLQLVDDIVSLEQFQTPFKNQGSRGTCYAFAACAAIEAAYKRKYGVEIDLSEQFAFHLNKAGELHPDYMTGASPHENNSSYWGFQGSSDIVDKLARAAVPGEAAAAYLDGPEIDQVKATTACGQLEGGTSSQEELDAFEFDERHIPTPARQAARFRITDYGALPGMPSPDQVEAVLRGGHEVVADVPGHCILLVGFDHDRAVYRVKNSWGEDEFIELAYSSSKWPIQGGRFVIDVEAVDAPAQRDAYWVGRWHQDHDGWRGDLVIRRTTDYRHAQGEPTKLGSYYRDGQRHDVNGVTSQDGQALHYWIADGVDKVEPGSPSGQEFWAYVFSGDCRKAAGSTSWGDSRFGVTLSRNDISGTPSDGFDANDWVGDWAMNHDGWEGTLSIESVAPFKASYQTSWDQVTLPVSGAITGGSDHFIEFTIPFFPDQPQDFRIFGHTRENDVFSGITLWGGRVYGVQGHRTLVLHHRLLPGSGIDYPRPVHIGPVDSSRWP